MLYFSGFRQASSRSENLKEIFVSVKRPKKDRNPKQRARVFQGRKMAQQVKVIATKPANLRLYPQHPQQGRTYPLTSACTCLGVLSL